MKRAICLLTPWLLLLAACANDTRAAKGELADGFVPLLSKLNPESDLVLLADLAEAAKTFEQGLDDWEKAPLVAKNPALLQMWKMQRATLDTMLASLKVSVGVDLLKDLGRAAVGVRLLPDNKPGIVAVVSGKFPPDLPAKMDPDAKKERIGGQDVWKLPNGMGMAVVDGKYSLFADLAEFPALLRAKKDPRGLLKRHPDLLASMDPGLLFRLSFAVPAWLRSMLPDGMAGVSTLKGLEHVEIDVGAGLRFRARAQDDRAAENIRYFAEGWKELMIGGRNLMRAYLFFALGLDLQYLSELPPQLAGVFENRAAILETMDAWLGEHPAPPQVVLKNREVTLTASKQALVGNVFIFGILAAIAIPAFIQYIRRSKTSEAEENLMVLQKLEEAYHARKGKYLACGPLPASAPVGDPVKWPADACFLQLGFEPEMVYFSYQVALVGEGSYVIRASADLDGDGQPMIWVLKPGDAAPQLVTAPGEY
jgi:hypothetical protein